MTFRAVSRKRCGVSSAIAALLAALGFAVRLGEDNQIGSSNAWSLRVWAAAGVFAYWALLQLVVLLFRRAKR